MSLSFSTGLRNNLLTNASFKSLMDNSVLRLYSGPIPAGPCNADVALGVSNILIAEISVDSTGTGVTFQSPAGGGFITKNLSEVWSGDVIVTGVPTFFRLVKLSDDGLASTTLYRVQGTAGAGNADLGLTSDTLFEDAPIRIGFFQIAFPPQ
jgi:hypothetical protein